jgi:hypothetical protein
VKEEWKDIEEFDGAYQVSNHGNIRKANGTHLGKTPQNNGYLNIKFSHNGKKNINRTAHRLVATAFIPNPDGKPQVNHIDGDKQNNHADNLEWVTQSENLQHAAAMGKDTKLTQDEVLYICYLIDDGYSNSALAAAYGVSRGTIQDIRSGKNWGWLTGRGEAA